MTIMHGALQAFLAVVMGAFGAHGLEKAREHEDRREARLGQEGVEEKAECAQAHESFGNEEELAAVDAVGERAAPETKQQYGHHLHGAEEAHVEGTLGDLVNLVGHSHVADHAPERGDELPEEEQAEVAVLAER